jgi:hypothetical protein
MWAGEFISPTNVLIAYTYAGDANLSGNVTGDDYFRIDAGYASRNTASPLRGWVNGDFDYNGRINADDYFLIDRSYARQGAAYAINSGGLSAGISAVPEPGALALAAGALFLRRSRRCKR